LDVHVWPENRELGGPSRVDVERVDVGARIHIEDGADEVAAAGRGLEDARVGPHAEVLRDHPHHLACDLRRGGPLAQRGVLRRSGLDDGELRHEAASAPMRWLRIWNRAAAKAAIASSISRSMRRASSSVITPPWDASAAVYSRGTSLHSEITSWRRWMWLS